MHYRIDLCSFAMLVSTVLCWNGFAGQEVTPSPQLLRATMTDTDAPAGYRRPEILISTAELSDTLKKMEPTLVLIDGRSDEAYNISRLPGARHIHSDMLQAPETPPYYMPSAEAFKKLCTDIGIHANSRIVIYDQDDGRQAARIWFTLYAYGHDNACILNGGLNKWQAEMRPVLSASLNDQEAVRIRPGTFEPAATLRGVCSFDELARFRTRVHTLGKLPPTTLLDGRSMKEYMGEEVRGTHGGHIPGAANMEWSALLSPPVPLPKAAAAESKDAGRDGVSSSFRVWRTAHEIHAILRLSGVERDQPVAVYDQAGGRSAHLFFTLHLMGFDHAFNYVAGWREYGNRDDVEVEK